MHTSVARILILAFTGTSVLGQYFRPLPPPSPFYTPMSPYHFRPSDRISSSPPISLRYDSPYPVAMVTSAASPSPYRGHGQGPSFSPGPGYGYAYQQFGSGPQYEASPYESSPPSAPQPFARGHQSRPSYHGNHGYEDSPPQYYGGGGGSGYHSGYPGPLAESAPYYGHSSHPQSYPSKPKHLIQPHIHREHVHVHNIYKVAPPHQEIFRHNVHHHNVKKEHIHQPVYHLKEKHVHTDSQSHKDKYHVKEYNKHKPAVTQETHKWLKPIYAESSPVYGKTLEAHHTPGTESLSSGGAY